VLPVLGIVAPVKPLVRHLLIGGVVVAIVLVITAIGGVAAFVLWPPSAPHSHVPAALQKSLDAKVAATQAAYDEPGVCASLGAKTCSLVCTANTFDLDPRNATTLDEVTAAYANIGCKETDSLGIDGGYVDVFAVHFTSPVKSAQGDDDATRADLAKIFPPHAVGAAWWYYTDGASTSGDRMRWLRSI
jgi:hypothetical protein